MATETTDSMGKAEQALARMDEAAARAHALVTRLISEHRSMPQLLAVHVEASTNRAFVGLQPRTEADARLWAEALGVTLETSKRSQDDHGYYVHLCAEFVLDGVQVRLGSAEWVSAARAAEAVAA